MTESHASVHGLLDLLVERCNGLAPLKMAVACPTSEVALRGALLAARRNLIDPILVGPEPTIRGVARAFDLELGTTAIVDASGDEDAVQKAVALCRSGRARALMKGNVHTDLLMHAVIRSESGLTTGRRMSHVFVLDVPTYSRLLFITDAAINIYPTLEDKVAIVNNAIDLAHALGIDCPNVALVSAVETVTPKILSTIDAAALCKMAERGQIVGAVLDGPLAFDTAVSPDAARIKSLASPVAGRADVLVVPDLESGNMLAKQLEYLGGAALAGVVVGARVPIVLTSRADTAASRLASCAIAALSGHASARWNMTEPATR
jgi:phosphate acetyltransferase